MHLYSEMDILKTSAQNLVHQRTPRLGTQGKQRIVDHKGSSLVSLQLHPMRECIWALRMAQATYIGHATEKLQAIRSQTVLQ